MFEYNLTDHLGNVRVTFGGHSNGEPEVLQVTDYYPFGLVMAQQNFVGAENSMPNKYLYNGKELQDDVLGGTALDWYDYGARMYDPTIGRWHTPDPLGELSRKLSPYTYCFNNPIKFIDIDGYIPWNKTVASYNRIGDAFGTLRGIDPTTGTIRWHQGQDISANLGTSVRSFASGDIATTGKNSSWGNYIVIDHGNNFFSLYAHLQDGTIVKKSGHVNNGEDIASVGSTGHSTGPHLHLEVGKANNLNAFLSSLNRKTTRMDPQEIFDLQEYIDNGYQNVEKAVNEGNSTQIETVTVTAKGPTQPKSIDAHIEDMLWQSVRPNKNGNTGRYNQPGRSIDQYYSDEFLKWYYGK